MIQKGTKALFNWFAPKCDVSGKRFVGANRVEEYRELLKLNMLPVDHLSKVDNLSDDSFKKLIRVTCDLSGNTFDLHENKARELKRNYRQYGIEKKEVSNAILVSPKAFKNFSLSRCSKSGRVFYTKNNWYPKYVSELQNYFEPSHPDYKLSSRYLSSVGYKELEVEVAEIRLRYTNWIGSVKGDHIGRHKILHVRNNVSTDQKWESPSDVESRLKWMCAQLGCNAMINYSWEIHTEEHAKKYIAGYGPKGNPYYKTKWHREKWFTGKGTGVCAEPRKSKKAKTANAPSKKKVRGSAFLESRGDKYFSSILNIKSIDNPSEIKKAYELLSEKYKPSSPIETTADIEKLHKYTGINEAYQYFRVKLGF